MNGEEFKINPTASRESLELIETGQYSDIALTNLFAVNAAEVASVRDALWKRYSAMLFANSVLFAFLGKQGQPEYQTALGAFGGIVLCIVWYRMLRTDWKWLRFRIEEAKRFKWIRLGEKANPFAEMTMPEGERFGKKILKWAAYPIGLFFLLHSLVFLAVLWPEITKLLPLVNTCPPEKTVELVRSAYGWVI